MFQTVLRLKINKVFASVFGRKKTPYETRKKSIGLIGWWFQPLKNTLLKMGGIFPNFRGETSKYLSCHQPVMNHSCPQFFHFGHLGSSKLVRPPPDVMPETTGFRISADQQKKLDQEPR